MFAQNLQSIRCRAGTVLCKAQDSDDTNGFEGVPGKYKPHNKTSKENVALDHSHIIFFLDTKTTPGRRAIEIISNMELI